MKKLLIAVATLATIATPLAASAQNYETRHDRREMRQDQRDARRDGYVNRNERREIQGDRRELRNDRWDRNNRTWWRGRNEFRGYTGRRAGYWYAPGYGYRQVDRRYVGYNWRRGGYVPAGYRNYYVPSSYYGFYGLRAAPYGQRWVYVDGNLALISLSTGLIADMIYNAY
jgi:Ni/Co efflux regulator RcnB